MSSRDPVFRHRAGYMPRSPPVPSHFETNKDWATPQLAGIRKVRSFDYNCNRVAAISQPTSPTNFDRVHKNATASDFSGGMVGLPRKHSDATELAELLAIQQEHQLQIMRQSPNMLSQKKWASCSNLSQDRSTPPLATAGFGQLGSGASQHYGGYGYHTRVTSTHSMPPDIVTTAREGAEQETSSLMGEFVAQQQVRHSKSPGHFPDDPDRWNSIVVAKDELIRQKDEIIDRQKKTLAQLQHQQVDMDSKLQLALMTQAPDVSTEVFHKLQDSQYENSKLHAQLKQLTRDKDTELARLKHKLGEKEYQLQQMNSREGKVAAKLERQLEKKIAEKDKLLKETEQQLELTKEDLVQTRREKRGMKNYIGGRITEEEEKDLVKQREKNRELSEAKVKLEDSLDRKLKEVDTLKTENTKLKGKVEGLEAALNKSRTEGPVTEIDYEELKMEYETLKAELNRKKKSLETKHDKMKAMHQEAQKTQKHLETRLSQEEDAGTALRRELADKQNTITDLRASIKEIAVQSQDLLVENLDLKSTCDKLQESNSNEHIEARQKLWKELQICIAGLKDLVEVCVARKDGKEPEISRLLGISRGSLDGSRGHSNWQLDSLDDLRGSAKLVRALRDDVDSVRDFLTNQYAEDVGRNCIMQ